VVSAFRRIEVRLTPDATRSNRELWTWIAIAFAMTALFAPSPVAIGCALSAAIALGWSDPRIATDRQSTAVLMAVVAWPIFFYLRTHVLNQDGTMLTPKFERDVPVLGAHLTHDELLELFVHSRVWYYTNRWWNWSVTFSYQVVSCTAGSLFVYALLRLTRRLARDRAWLFLAGALSGGSMQLFFGDVENYSVTAAIVMLYVLAACRFIARETTLWVPIVVLAVATCFHLEAAWLLPSAVYLFVVSRDREGSLRDVWRSAMIGAAVAASVFVSFHFYGLPLWRFFSSHAGHALRGTGAAFAISMPAQYYVDQLNLLALLCPAAALLLPFAIWHRRPMDETTAFLGIATASMLAFQAVWKAQLGVFDDWNLYATGGLIAALLVWRYAAMAAVTPGMRIAGAALAAVGWLHTYGWIIAHHRLGP
jgi:hypothetical protein